MTIQYLKELEETNITLQDALESELFASYRGTKKFDSYITKLKHRKLELEKLVEKEKTKNMGLNRYVIFDVNANLFNDDYIAYADNSREAVEKLMKEQGIEGKIKRSGANDVRFKATKTIIKDNQVYRSGNAVWYSFTA